MLELGESEAEDTRRWQGCRIAAIDEVHCVGPRMQACYRALDPGKRGRWVETAEEMIGLIRRLIHAGRYRAGQGIERVESEPGC